LDLIETQQNREVRTTHRSRVDRVLDLFWLIWIATLPLGHATGIHNTLAVVVIAGSLLRTRAVGFAEIPALPWLIAFTALACLSLTWSALPSVSGGKLRTDLLLPLFGYVAAFCWARQGGARPMFYGLVVGLLLLALFSAVELIPLRVTASWPGLDPADRGGHRYAHLYPGVGDASADAILVIAPLLVWRRLTGHWRDATTSLLALAAVLVIIVSKNRDSVFLFPFSVALFAALCTWRKPLQRLQLPIKSLIGTGAVMIVAALVLLELVSQRRLAEAHQAVPFGKASVTLFALDPRPQMWAEYIRLGSAKPFFGAGFGRTVPAQIYDVAHDPVMIAAHANLLEHAHDYLLNVWLQLGLVGVILMVGALISAWRAAAAGLSRDPPIALASAGALTLLVTTLLRNAVDDFLVYAMASAFWIALGLLFGLMRANWPQATDNASV
jgi:O-antigen ligase